MSPRLDLALFTIAATLAYLGLAILGRGGFAAFFSHAALIALAIALVLLAGAALFTQGNLSAGEREDRANRWVLIAFGLIGVLAAYLPAYTDRKGFWILDGETVRWLGVALFAAGGLLRIWPVFVLGRRFSGLVAIQPGHTLPLLARIHAEERLLHTQFGDEYDAYRSRTSRLIPGMY